MMRLLSIRLICKAQDLIGQITNAKPHAVALSTNKMLDFCHVLLTFIILSHLMCSVGSESRMTTKKAFMCLCHYMSCLQGPRCFTLALNDLALSSPRSFHYER